MSNGVLEVRSAADLRLFGMDPKSWPAAIVFHPSVTLPPARDEIVTGSFEAQTQYLPYGFRRQYLHPSLYHAAVFADDYPAKLNAVRAVIKNGTKAIFHLDARHQNSVLNACCLMGQCFLDCLNPSDTPYADITNVPFPLKLSDATPNCWIWGCWWPQTFTSPIGEPDRVRAFVNQVRLDFAPYDSRFFPVRQIAHDQEGVTGFTVKCGSGEILVTPQPCGSVVPTAGSRDTVVLRVLSFPATYDTGKHCRVALNLLWGQVDVQYQAPVLPFLRFLLLLYASQGDRRLGFRLHGKELDTARDLVIVDSNGQRGIPHAYLFQTETGTKDWNFLSADSAESGQRFRSMVDT